MTRDIAVAGVTTWGLTLASLLDANGRDVTIIARSPAEAETLARERRLARLPALQLGARIVVSHPAATDRHDRLVLAVPAQALRDTLAGLPFEPASVLSAAKGIELKTGLRMSEVVKSLRPGAAVSALSGPNLAGEIVAGQPAAAVIAAPDEAEAIAWQDSLSTRLFRCYRSLDVVGVELAGALKNVIAIAAGAAWGLGMGANTVAALMTRGLAEIARLGVALGAQAATFQGLAGMGDLAATCFSPLSRNRRFGELLAQGHNEASALAAIGEAVEGAPTARAACALALQHHVQMPISMAVQDVLEGRIEIREAVGLLLSREPRPE